MQRIELHSLLQRAAPGPLIAHSDAGATAHLVDHKSDRSDQLAAHIGNISAIGTGRDLYMPSFNYDYCRTGVFDINNDISQVGPISEAFRLSRDTARTSMPVFSFVTAAKTKLTMTDPRGTDLDPFDDCSVFGSVVGADGVILWYGAPLQSTTLLHHAERCVGGVPYRYDKFFAGSILRDGRSTSARLRYHVWPMGSDLDYDWTRLEAELVTLGVLQSTPSAAALKWANARAITEFLVDSLRKDPLSLLDSRSRSWTEERLQQLGRPFRLEDFE